MISKQRTALLIAPLAALALAGCSQVSAMQQVSGVPMTTLTIAANDVLVAQKVPVMVSPKCEVAAAMYTCTGQTLTKEPIVVSAPEVEVPGMAMTITVAGKEIFKGSVNDVINEAQTQGENP